MIMNANTNSSSSKIEENLKTTFGNSLKIQKRFDFK